MKTNEDYYISRNALLEHFEAHVHAHQVGETEREIWSAAYEDVDNFDLADVAPVVHAKWNKDGTCSACCHETFYDEWIEPRWDYDWDENLVQTGEEIHIQFMFSPYCPNCGAKMDAK